MGGGGAYKRFTGQGNSAAVDYKSWRRWAEAKLIVEKSKGTAEEALGPLLLTLLDGEAAEAVEHLTLKALSSSGGEQLLLTTLAERFPERENADRVGDALQGIFSLSAERTETTTAYTGRARTLFQRARKEEIDLPDVAKGFLVLRGAKLGPSGRAVVLAASQRKWGFEEICQAIRTTYPGTISERGGAGAHVVDAWSLDAPDDAAPIEYDQEDAEIEALITSYDDPMEEEDTLDVLATWKQARHAASQEKLKRGLPAGRPDLARLRSRNRCYTCQAVGHFSRDCPTKGRGKGAGGHPTHKSPHSGGPSASFNSARAMATECGATTSFETMVESERLRRLGQEMQEAEDPNEEVAVVDCFVLHDSGHGVVDTACQISVIGEETLEKHLAASGDPVRWTKEAPRRFKGFTGAGVLSKGSVLLPWKMGGRVHDICVHVVPGTAGLLLSKRQLKEFGAVINMSTDMLELTKLGVSIPMSETEGEHYSVDLTGGLSQPFQ